MLPAASFTEHVRGEPRSPPPSSLVGALPSKVRRAGREDQKITRRTFSETVRGAPGLEGPAEWNGPPS